MALSVKIKETTHKILSGRKRLQILQDVAFYGVFFFIFIKHWYFQSVKMFESAI